MIDGETACQNQKRNNSGNGPLQWDIQCDAQGNYLPKQCTRQTPKWCACYNSQGLVTQPSRAIKSCECLLAKAQLEAGGKRYLCTGIHCKSLNRLWTHFRILYMSPSLEHIKERFLKHIWNTFWSTFLNTLFCLLFRTLSGTHFKTHYGTQFSSEHISPRFLEHILERFSKHFGGTLKKHIVERFADHIRNGTGCYKVVTLPSTGHVRCCLTLVIVRERVLSTWYGCWQSVKML